MSTTEQWHQAVTAYVDGELSDAERAALEARLAEDPALRALEVRVRQTAALMKTLPAPAPSAQLRARVMAGLDARGAPPGAWSWPRAMPLFAVAAAALLAVVVRGALGDDDEVPAFVADDQVLLARSLDVVEDLDLAGLTTPEDLEVVEQLSALEVSP
ncbi:MAG: zf-HC2 domain-containing protein [Myxococcaceae bacterium]|jgi:anti-sigma factor RsiW|nr:zf-HC2 domain-containing protein [Myxococcaceae bacterium]MCA3014892.1 zf-HC2 domain-containing protein [Myxococcaceae bacterium]